MDLLLYATLGPFRVDVSGSHGEFPRDFFVLVSAPLPRQHDVEAMNPFRVRMVTSAFPAPKSTRGKRRRQRAISVPISAAAGMDLTKTRSTATASAVSAVSRSSSSTILKQTSFARGEIA